MAAARKVLYSVRKEEAQMRPFNLQEALAGKRVVLRNLDATNQVKKVYHIPEAVYPVLVVYENGSTSGRMIDGRWETLNRDDGLDLVMASEKKVGWVNIYWRVGRASKYVQGPFDHEEQALQAKYNGDLIATVKIEWEE